MILYLGLAAPLLAVTADPGATAVHFLEQVRTKTLNLEPGGDTALAPQTSESKRREIGRRLERMARDIGDDQLEVGAVKLDDELAAVLVRKIGGFDPGRMQVFPVALVKRGAQWVAAPVPASYENSGLGYAASLRQRVTIMEDWMLREQTLDLDKIRDQAAERMRRKIAESLSPATLRGFNSAQTADRFLTACERRNLPEVLGLLGGLAATLPNDWQQRFKAADGALAAASEAKHPWRLLLAAEVLRVRVHHEEDAANATVSIACLDPASGRSLTALPRVELVHLELSKSPDGLWRIDLPENFLADSATRPDAMADDLDADLLDEFPARLAVLYPPSPQPSAELARQVLLEKLQAGSPAALMHLVRLNCDPQDARKACVHAAKIWWALHESSTVRSVIPLAMHEDGSQAAAAVQFFSARNPDQLDLRIIYFDKSSDGWQWTPAPPAETEKKFSCWQDRQANRWSDEWQDVLLGECPALDMIPDTGAPSDEAVRKLIELWIQATRADDVRAALRLTARLKVADSKTTLLRNLGYEMAATPWKQKTRSIVGIYRGSIWTAVGTQRDPPYPPAFPLYPVIATPAGPRILLEVDLYAGGSRSRDFLNKTALNRLRKANAPATDELTTLFAEYQAQVAKPAKP